MATELTTEDREQLAAPIACRPCALKWGKVYTMTDEGDVDLQNVFGSDFRMYLCPNCQRRVLVEL